MELRDIIQTGGLVGFLLVVVVYGGFKGQVVKERVYEPDWQTEERVRYTMNVADILAEVAPTAVNPSIQTPPMGFKPKVTGPEVVAEYTSNVMRVVAHLVDIERRTGKTITLAIEPEPHCFVETTDEAIDYFANYLYSGATVERFARVVRLPISEANATLRKHLGVVYDVGHQAVEYEDISVSLPLIKQRVKL